MMQGAKLSEERKMDRLGSQDSLSSYGSGGRSDEAPSIIMRRQVAEGVSMSGSFSNSPRTLRMSRTSSREQILNEFARSNFDDRSGENGKAETTVWFEVSVSTEPGDLCVVTGNLLPLGFWDPRNGIPLTTHKSTYPKWTAVATVPSGEAVEYKYVIVKADGTFLWEADIKNRVFTAEGTELRLNDGQFNVQKNRALKVDLKEVTNRRYRLSSLSNAADLPFVEPSACIYILTYRLPLVTTFDPVAKRYRFQWLSFDADNKAQESKGDGAGVMRSVSRHGIYIIENFRSLRSRCKVWYVGGLACDVPREYRDQVTEDLAAQFQCVPVFLEASEAQKFEDFCHGTLKPVFHFVQPTSNDMCKSYEKGGQDGNKWQLYCSVNLKFVNAVVQNFNDGDFVFAFDLELMMTPTLVGSRARSANICFFFNTPFPSSEIFRAIPVRKEILRSLLNADMIQFHCFTYARHFLSNCSTLLGIEFKPTRGGLLQLNYNGHLVHVRACHVGIDAQTVTTRLQEDKVLEQQKLWRDQFAAMGRSVIILGYDDMEPLSGINLKLNALQRLLTLFPEYQNKILLVQVGIKLYDRRGEVMHQDYIDSVTQRAKELEAEFPGCILLLSEKMAFARRTALFSMSDMYCSSSIRHGLSLVPFEYVLACASCPGAKSGSLVISEFAACSRVIPGTMKVNPSRDGDFARAIHRTLEQPLLERKHWQQQQSAWCSHNTVQLWAETIVTDMQKVRSSTISAGGTLRSASCRVGLTKSTYKEISTHTLKLDTVYHALAQSHLQRLVLVDVDLLIRPKDEMKEYTKAALLRSLMTLAAEGNTHVFLLSSERRDLLLQWLGDLQGLEHVGLAAEDGYYYKWPGSPSNRWDVRQHVTAEWKEVANVMMQQYMERTTGTLIESDKVACITWHYGTAHTDWARMQSKELMNQLKDTLEHLPVEVLIGKSFLKVRHQEVHKGALVGHILSHYGLRGGVDFILCLGDDSLDAGLFTLLKDFHNNQDSAQPLSLFACTVGKQPSVATHCLYTLEEAHELICGLSLQTKRNQGAKPQAPRSGSSKPIRMVSTMLELSGMS